MRCYKAGIDINVSLRKIKGASFQWVIKPISNTHAVYSKENFDSNGTYTRSI